MKRLVARFKLFMGIKGIRHRDRMYKLCDALNLK
jgi:hypothetical protein